MSLPRYPKYKDSGVEWLGEIPEHWSVSRLKTIAKINMGQSPDNDDCNDAGDGVPFLQGNADFGSYSPSPRIYCTLARKTAKRHDILLSVRAPVGAINIADQVYGIGRGLCAVSPLVESLGRFVYHFLEVAKEELFSVATGSTYESVSVEQVGNSHFCVPSVEEALGIGRFLDRETGTIDALVEEQQRLIELLKEKRQAVISHAVTKGLNPDAPMKDSGVEWMGVVPTNWKVFSLGRVTLSACDGPFGSGLKSDHYTDDGVRVIRLQNLRDGKFDATDSAFIALTHYANLGDHDVRGGDLLIAGLGDDRNAVGRACVAPQEIEPAMVKADCFRFRLTPDALPPFVAAQLSVGAPFDAGRLATGSTRSRIPVSKMASRTIALPKLEEQADIVSNLHEREMEFAQLSSQAERVIALLQERRMAIISAAVTGKIDVRGLVKEVAA
jgi:type I restriction enzyme S subunit